MSNGTNNSGISGGGSAGGGSSSGGAGGAGGAQAAYQVQNATLQPTAAMATAANNAAFAATDSRPFHQMYNGRQYFQNQNLTIDQQLATINYLSPTTETGSLYSMSQNMNYALANGRKLNANQQYVYNHLMGAMHNLGENAILTRYDHSAMVNSLLKQNGLSQGHENYSIAQLKQALVGTTYGENKFVSTSYNDFKNAPSSTKSVFDSRAVKITYHAKASTQAMMPGNGPGGSLGEIVLAPSGGRQNMRIVDVRLTGNTARRQGTQSYSIPQIELVVEVD